MHKHDSHPGQRPERRIRGEPFDRRGDEDLDAGESRPERRTREGEGSVGRPSARVCLWNRRSPRASRSLARRSPSQPKSGRWFTNVYKYGGRGPTVDQSATGSARESAMRGRCPVDRSGVAYRAKVVERREEEEENIRIR